MNNAKSTENTKTKNLTEGRLDNRVSLSFRLGVMVSLALVVLGLALVAIAGAKGIEPTPPLSQLLEGKVDPKTALHELMTRELRIEAEL